MRVKRSRLAEAHAIDATTGFLQSNGEYAHVFDAQRKTAFLRLYGSNGLRLRRTCRSMGMSESTINHHCSIDPEFRRQFDDVERDYIDELEGVSRDNALNPRSVIERIFQLKCLLPSKYGQENRPVSTVITINLDGKILESAERHRDQIDSAVDAEIVAERAKVGQNADDAGTIERSNVGH